MNRKLIVFAQKSEAEQTIKKLHAEPLPESVALIWLEGNIPTCYTFEGGLIAISNIGIHSAQNAVSKYIHQVDTVWNIGLAGALKNDLPIGTLTQIDCVGKHSFSPYALDEHSQKMIENTLPSFAFSQQGAKLISSDFPIHDTKTRDSLSSKWDLVDMEGYGVASAAAAFNKPCFLYKIISDFASPGGRELIRKNKPLLSEQIANFIINAKW